MTRLSLGLLTGLFLLFGTGLTLIEPSAAPATPEWSVEGQWIDTCSCTIACPCWKTELPTLGHCSEMIFFHIDKGHYGNTRLVLSLCRSQVQRKGNPLRRAEKTRTMT